MTLEISFCTKAEFSSISGGCKELNNSHLAARLIVIFAPFYRPLSARLSICSFRTFHFRTFYRSRSAITGSSGNSGKGGDGLIAISSRSGRLFLSHCPPLSSRHYNPTAYNFSARERETRPTRRLRWWAFFRTWPSTKERRCLLKNEE